MDFEDFKQNWQEVKAPDATKDSGSHESLVQRIKNLNRKMIFSNLAGSIALSFTILFIGWIWHEMPNRSWMFYGAIVCVMVIILISIVLMWWRLPLWSKSDLTLSSHQFVENTLIKLKRTRFVRTQFMPAYNTILFLSIMLYALDILQGASMAMQVGILGGNAVFMTIIIYVSMRFSKKKQENELEPLIKELEDIRNGLRELSNE